MLTFDHREHAYYWTGRRVPGVTDVLEAAGLYDFGGARNLDEALARGRIVHRLTELHDHDDLDEASIEPAFAGYLEGWKRFLRETGFVCDRIEEKVYCGLYRYAGTLDRTGHLRRPYVQVDIKSGSPQKATGPQTAAYAHALGPQHQKMPRYGCYLQADGRYELIPYNDRHDFSIFLAALSLYNFRGLLNVRNDRKQAA